MSHLRLAILPDYPQEQWPSMDLCSEMLERNLSGRQDLCVRTLHPPYRRVLGNVPFLPSRNVDRVINRMRTYPHFVRRHVKDFDCFHVVDHSYSQLLNELPIGSTGVFCHDLDTFRCVLDPTSEPRPRWFRAMVRRILKGFEKAAILFHTTAAVRRQLLQHGLADESKLVQVRLGVAPEFSDKGSGTVIVHRNNATSDLDCSEHRPEIKVPDTFIFHVGSCIARKRIDVLLDVFAEVRRRMPGVRLIQAGGRFTEAQLAQIQRLGIADGVEQRHNLTRSQLADLYRAASAVLVTSEAEGFGLPVIEALACCAPVIASDIEPLREVGADAVTYCGVGDVHAWSRAVCGVLGSPSSAPSCEVRLHRAAQFSWRRHADTIAAAYLRLCAGVAV